MPDTHSLPAVRQLVDRAIAVLSNARSAAEVLDASDLAAAAYDAAKRAARIGKAKQAHDSLIADARRVQANALEIEAAAKRRLADEYDAAQERGEIATASDKLRHGPVVPKENDGKPTAADLGLSRKDIHEARVIRDAEEAEPGIVSRTIKEAVEAGEEPTRAKVKRAAKKAAAKKQKRPKKPKPVAEQESEHDRDLRMLRNVWSTACASAQQAFLHELNSSHMAA